MRLLGSRAPGFLAVLVAVLGLAAPAPAAEEVDLALVLAVDISNSMDPEEQELQRKGFVEAFRSPAVQDAIRGGALGRIAVTYLEWAGTAYQTVTVPWTVIEDPESAADFTERLERAPIRRGPRTSISGAIEFGMRMLKESGVDSLRQVIDVSGDGPNNQGRLVTEVRDEALAAGITINGLPIMLKRASGYWDVSNLDEYYRDCVIGGAGAFMVPVRERHHFAEAIRTKIIREIAGYESQPFIHPAQAESRSTHCIGGSGWSWDREYR
jgi:Protein of unknown function (DUF1194)